MTSLLLKSQGKTGTSLPFLWASGESKSAVRVSAKSQHFTCYVIDWLTDSFTHSFTRTPSNRSGQMLNTFCPRSPSSSPHFIHSFIHWSPPKSHWYYIMSLFLPVRQWFIYHAPKHSNTVKTIIMKWAGIRPNVFRSHITATESVQHENSQALNKPASPTETGVTRWWRLSHLSRIIREKCAGKYEALNLYRC